MNSRLTDLPLSGKTLPLDDRLQVFFLPAVQYLPHSACQRQGRAFGTDSPYPNPLQCAGSLGSCLQISRMGHSTLAELTGGLGCFTEMKVLGTGGIVRRGECREGSALRGAQQEGTPKGPSRKTCTDAMDEPWKHF